MKYLVVDWVVIVDFVVQVKWIVKKLVWILDDEYGFVVVSVKDDKKDVVVVELEIGK